MPGPLSRCLAALVFVAAVSACSRGTPDRAQAPLAGAAIGGPFTLMDSTGKTVRWSDFDGRYRIVYFGYTYCPDACPLDVQRIARGFALFKQVQPGLAKQVQPLFVSIDPARDTPAKVGEFARAFSPDIMGLTGTDQQVADAAKAFKAYYKKVPASAPDQYVMDHSRTAYLMGRKGEPIALLPIDVADQGKAVAAELAKWVS